MRKPTRLVLAVALFALATCACDPLKKSDSSSSSSSGGGGGGGGGAGGSASLSINGDCRATTATTDEAVTANQLYRYYDIPYTPTSNVTLTSVAVVLSSSSCSTYTTEAATMTLYADNGSGDPGSGLASGPTISCSQLSTSPTLTSFAISASLTGGTTYHFVLMFGGLNNGDTVQLTEYATAGSNCPGNDVGGILTVIDSAWQNVTSPAVGMLWVN